MSQIEQNRLLDFLTIIKEKSLPSAKAINEKIEDWFSDENSAALENIKQLFDLVCSQEFCELVDETGIIEIHLPNRPMTVFESSLNWNNLSSAAYYQECLMAGSRSWIMGLDRGMVQIMDRKFEKASDLYMSKYRLIMSKVTLDFLKCQITKELMKEGVMCD